MTDTPQRRRTTRPDTAVEPKPLEVEGAEAGDADISEGDEADADEAEAAPQIAPPPVAVKGPYTTKGILVLDSNQRTVCMAGGPHLSPQGRADLAEFIASKLNA